MIVCYIKERMPDQLIFGIEALEKALRERGIPFYGERLCMYRESDSEAIAVRIQDNSCGNPLPPEGFSIKCFGGRIEITGADPNGAMYGLFEAAERIRYYGLDAVSDCTQSPFLKKRGVKFNLPHQTYAEGDAFEKNYETVKDREFWRGYIDFLALNRYNCLSLWSENPFEIMTSPDKYPATSPLNPQELKESKELYSFIFSHAKKRGLETYIITWNLRISPAIARGLGLPEELAEQTHDVRSIQLRQHQELIKDYFREAVKTLVLTYPDMTGLGSSNSEELVGSAEVREQWLADTYLAALTELDCPVPFIHRTNQSNGSIAQNMFLEKYDCDEKYVSWKYSNAHMYSHPRPRFEELFDAWGGQDMSRIKVLYTVRNDDFHNLRGCDPAFISAYFKGMDKPYVHGFYWGADSYLWAGEFQHVERKHLQWKYSYEKHWMQFEMIGRLSYDPELPEDIWHEKFTALYGREAGEAVYSGLCSGVRMLCASNRLFWLNYDYQWHPETLLSVFGFKTIIDFANSDSMPGVGTVSMKDFVRAETDGSLCQGETPNDILGILDSGLAALHRKIADIEALGRIAGELECVLLDMKAWAALEGYYRQKFAAALELLWFKATGDPTRKAEAVRCLERALQLWRELAEIGASHYLPYRMARVKQIFGWGYYTDEVREDIIRAEEF